MRLTVIGRDPKQAEIVISNEYVSNYHAELIQLDNGDMFIIDKSTNGTFLDGSRLAPGKETPVRRGADVTFTALGIPLDWSAVPYLKTPEEMAELFSYVPEAISNTVVIAQKCNEEPCFDLKDNGDPIKDKSLIPGYTPEDGSDPKDYLTKLTWEGLKKRYGEITEAVKKRADYELGIILGMGFAEYYLNYAE